MRNLMLLITSLAALPAYARESSKLDCELNQLGRQAVDSFDGLAQSHYAAEIAPGKTFKANVVQFIGRLYVEARLVEGENSRFLGSMELSPMRKDHFGINRAFSLVLPGVRAGEALTFRCFFSLRP